MQLFYTQLITDGFGHLDETDSRHCIKVLRKNVGDILHITDGKGNLYKVSLLDKNTKACQFKVSETTNREKRANHYLHVAIAPTKQISRFEWFLEKAIEIGVDEITPLVSKYSERNRIKEERLNKIMIAAMKQSLQTFLPKLNPLTDFSDLLERPTNASKYIAYTAEKDQVLEKQFVKGDSLFVIGPEGGFSEKEVEAAKGENYRVVSLGENRLRTETAGVVVCQTAKTLMQ